MRKFALMAILLLTTTGCIGNLSSVHRVLEVSNGQGALIDIKQRAIISSVAPIYDENGRKVGNETRVCAEASPDSLSAYAAELAAKADSGKVGAEIAAAFQEGASYVGMRTPTIQSLRDASYRLCESYLNRAISPEEYGWQLRRFQRNMVVLAAVEQLTGSMRVPSVTIKMQGQAEAAKSLSEITTEKQKTDAKIAELESGTVEEKEKNKDQLTTLKQNSKTMNDALANAKSVIAGGSATNSIETLSFPQFNPLYIASVSSDVTKMVSKIIDQDDRGQLCFIYLRDLQKSFEKLQKNEMGEPEKLINNQLQNICVSYLSQQQTGVYNISDSNPLKIEDLPDTTATKNQGKKDKKEKK